MMKKKTSNTELQQRKNPREQSIKERVESRKRWKIVEKTLEIEVGKKELRNGKEMLNADSEPWKQ